MLIVVAPLLLILAPSFSQKTSEQCEQFEEKLTSRPDFTHKVVTSPLPLPPDFVITSVTPDSSRGRSFYWCEMKVKNSHNELETLRRFGHNATHWWVTKGCGGWFIIRACRGVASDTTPTSTSTDNNVQTTPTTHSEAPQLPSRGDSHVSDTPRAQLFTDIDTSALLSLFSWLGEQGTSIENKLGADPTSRVIRSVDDEFAFELGYY